MPATDYLNPSESLSFRLGAALRDQCVARFLRSCYLPELKELARVATALRPALSEGSSRLLTAGLSARVDAFDAAAAKRDGRTIGARKFRALADAAEAALIAWAAANMATLRAQRIARTGA